MATAFNGTATRLSPTRAFTTPAFPTSTFPTSTNSSSTGGFNLIRIAAIVVPIIVVLSIVSFLYRRWRRAQGATSVVITTNNHPAPPPKFQTWNESQAQQNFQRPEGLGTFQQRFVAGEQWAAPVPPQSLPNSGAPHWQNAGMDHPTVPGPVWGRNSQTHQDVPIHSYPPPQDPQVRRHPSNLGAQATPTNNITYDQFIEEVERTRPVEGVERTRPVERLERTRPVEVERLRPVEEVERREPESNRNPWASGTPNQSYDTQRMRTTHSEPVQENQRSDVQLHPSTNNDGGRSSGGTAGAQHPGPSTQLSGPPGYQQSHPEPAISPMINRKADIVLEWLPTPETVPTNSQAGTSNIHAQNQSADPPELQMLRERVQRLEATLTDRAQSTQVIEESERPPAYESLSMPMPGIGAGHNNVDGRA